MAYTLTCEAGHKVKSGAHAGNFLAHIGRGADLRAGIKEPPDPASDPVRDDVTNSYIDWDRTPRNVVMVNDGNGGFRPADSSKDLQDYLDQRLSTLAQKPRKDAVVMRGMLLQLDPEYIDKVAPRWRETGDLGEAAHLHPAMVRWAAGFSRPENAVGYSIDVDESSVHVQFAFTPITEDGHLRQKAWFPGPWQMEAMHPEFRQYMAEASERLGTSYVPEFTVKPSSKSRRRNPEYKADKEKGKALKAAQDELAAEQAEIEVARERLEEREGILDSREAELPNLRRRAHEEGRAEGLADAEATIRARVEERLASEIEPVLAAAREHARRIMEKAENYKADVKAWGARRVEALKQAIDAATREKAAYLQARSALPVPPAKDARAVTASAELERRVRLAADNVDDLPPEEDDFELG